jgi:hypothetical protein
MSNATVYLGIATLAYGNKPFAVYSGYNDFPKFHNLKLNFR